MVWSKPSGRATTEYVAIAMTITISVLFFFFQRDKAERPIIENHNRVSMGQMYWVPDEPLRGNDQLVGRGVDLAITYSDLLLVQTPWSPHLDSKRAAKWLAELSHAHNRMLGISLDWMSESRLTLLESEGGSWSFSNDTVSGRFVRDALALTEAYSPMYLVLGVEVDFLARNLPEEFRAFVRAYNQAYDLVKASYPEVNVLVTFQYDHLVSDVLNEHPLDDSGVISAFGEKLDLVGLSLYPCQIHSRVQDIPGNYLASAALMDKPVGVFETAWPGVKDSERLQKEYVAWVLRQSQAHQFSPLVWTSTTDTSPAEGAPIELQRGDCNMPVALWNKYLGLWRLDGKPKPAAKPWVSQLERNRLTGKSAEEAIEGQTLPHSKPGY
jgi:hypothetical protein